MGSGGGVRAELQAGGAVDAAIKAPAAQVVNDLAAGIGWREHDNAAKLRRDAVVVKILPHQDTAEGMRDDVNAGAGGDLGKNGTERGVGEGADIGAL